MGVRSARPNLLMVFIADFTSSSAGRLAGLNMDGDDGATGATI